MIDSSRVRTFGGVICFFFALLVVRLFYLEVIRFHDYTIRSAAIRARVIPHIAPRGLILDRAGRVLASSRPVFSAYILPVKVEDAQATARTIASLLNMDVNTIYQKILKQKERAYEPLLIRDHLPFSVISAIEEQSHKLPGFVVGARNIRSYNYGSLASHVVGYIGEIDKETLAQKSLEGYHQGNWIGLAGIERYYESYLRGIDGGQQIEVDSLGRPTKAIGNIEPIPGNNVTLTLDLELQKVAEAALGNRKGAVVVIDPTNGEVLVLASHPGFDPNFFIAPISDEKWKKFHEGGNPLHNRALFGYPPGSTFKIVSAITALENNFNQIIDRFYCPGYFLIGNRHAQCWKAHGTINFFDAMVFSCDVVFYTVGLKAGPDLIHRAGDALGLGSKTNIDFPGETAGTLPSSKWKQRVMKEPWYPGDSINLGIGQGFLQITPIQLAQAMCVLANRGFAYQPHLLKEVTSPEQKLLYSYQPQIARKVSLKSETWDYLRDSMTQVVERGTGVATKIAGVKIAGKTGTAEDPPRRQPHAWFVTYAPVEAPRLAMAVFVESGGHGGTAAAPIARAVYEYYFNRLKAGIATVNEELTNVTVNIKPSANIWTGD